MPSKFAPLFRGLADKESFFVDSTVTTLNSLRVQSYAYGRELRTEFTVQRHPGTSFTPPVPHEIYVVTRMSRADVLKDSEDYDARSAELRAGFSAPGAAHMPSKVAKPRRGPEPMFKGDPKEVNRARLARQRKIFMDKNASLTIEQQFIPSLAELARLEQGAWSLGMATLTEYALWKGCTIVEFLVYLRDRSKAETGVPLKVEQWTLKNGKPGFLFTRADGKVPDKAPKGKPLNMEILNHEIQENKSFMERMQALQAAEAALGDDNDDKPPLALVHDAEERSEA